MLIASTACNTLSRNLGEPETETPARSPQAARPSPRRPPSRPHRHSQPDTAQSDAPSSNRQAHPDPQPDPADAYSHVHAHDRSDIDIPPGTSLEELEHAAVVKALEQHEGNRTRAAEALGISVRTLQRKLKAWAMDGVEVAEAFAAPAASGSPVPCAVGDDGRG